MLRVRVEDMDGGEGETYAFLRSPIRVGRGALNDLRLDRPYVSTWHGLIQFDDDGIRFVDLGSTNGTFLDGDRLERNAPAVITPARELTIGRLRLVLSRGGKSEVRKAPAEPVTHFALRVAEDVAAASMVDLKAVKAAAAAAVGVAPQLEDAPATAGDSFPALPADLPPLDLGNIAPPPPADLAPPPAAVLPPPVDAGPPDPEVERALQDASWQLGVLHDTCQRASEDFRVAFEQAVTSLGESQRERARALAAERYPHAFAGVPVPAVPAAAAVPPVAVPPVAALPSDPDAAAFAASFPQAAVAPAAVQPGLGGELRDDALRLVRAFATAYISAEAAPTTPAGLERFLGALAEALETAARGYLELRGGYEQFGREMGIRVPSSDGVLGRIADVRQLVGWLLQPSDGESRPRQLAGAFADLMIHQVALLNGVQAGARDLIDELSPEAVEKATTGGGLGLKALREAALWRTFTERHQELASEESAVTAVLFGQAFARAYTAVAGRRNPTGDASPSPVAASRKTRRRDEE